MKINKPEVKYMSEGKRITVSLTPELQQIVKALRKTDKFCLLSQSEIIRTVLTIGAKNIQNIPNIPTNNHGHQDITRTS